MEPTALRSIGRTDVQITQLGLGGGPFGRPEVTDVAAFDAAEAAWQGGVRYFDTAPWYGRGMSEHRVGRFLRTRTDEPYVLPTKVGRVLSVAPDRRRDPGDPRGGPYDFTVRYDYTRDGVLRSCEDSLQRLGLTAIDLAIVHDLDRGFLSPQARMDAHTDQLLTSGWETLRQLHGEGVVKAIGFGINEIGLMSRWLDLFDPDFFLVAGPYTLMEQGSLHEELARCVERGVGAIIGAVYGSGLLATGPAPGARYMYHEPSEEHLRRAGRLQEVCGSFDVPLAAAALQFPLGHPAVAAVIPGARSGAEVEANLAHFRRDIPDALWDALKSEGLIDKDAPTPTS
jgi:D-threo-aldose 1-dehydrogenase